MTTTAVEEEALTCMQEIFDRFSDGAYGPTVIYVDYEGGTQGLAMSNVAARFGYAPDKSDLVRRAIELGEENGCFAVDRTLIRRSQQGTKGKVYPAEYSVTVRMR